MTDTEERTTSGSNEEEAAYDIMAQKKRLRYKGAKCVSSAVLSPIILRLFFFFFFGGQ